MSEAAAAASGRQLAFLWAGIAVLLVLLSPLAPVLASGFPPCPLKTITSVPCPGCGTTRAALALARFDPAAAIRFNPLATVAAVLLVAGGLVAGALALAGHKVPHRLPRLPLAVRLAVVAALGGNWLYLVYAGI